MHSFDLRIHKVKKNCKEGKRRWLLYTKIIIDIEIENEIINKNLPNSEIFTKFTARFVSTC